MPSDRQIRGKLELARLNRVIETYPLRSRPSGRPEFNEWWALQERKLALLVEQQYPNARAWIRAEVRATRTGGVLTRFGRMFGRPGYIREWDVLLEWVAGPLKGRFTPLEGKTARHLIESFGGGRRLARIFSSMQAAWHGVIETTFQRSSRIAGQFRVDATLRQTDEVFLRVVDAVYERNALRSFPTRALDSTRAVPYGLAPDIPNATSASGGNGASARRIGTFNGTAGGVSFRNRPPPRVVQGVADELRTTAINRQIATAPARGRSRIRGVARGVAAGVRGLVGGILIDILAGWILGRLQAESERREIEEKLESSDASLVRQMRGAFDAQRPLLTRFTPRGTVLDLWFVVEIGFSYSHGEGAPGGVGALSRVYVSGEDPSDDSAPFKPGPLREVTLVAEHPPAPQEDEDRPLLIQVGIPMQFWNPGHDDLVGYWDLEPDFSWPQRRLRVVNRFEITSEATGLVMRHVGHMMLDARGQVHLPTDRVLPRSAAHDVSALRYDAVEQSLRFSVIWQNVVLEKVGALVPTDYYFLLSGPGSFVGVVVAPPARRGDDRFTFRQALMTVR